jgi:hypothetical protein
LLACLIGINIEFIGSIPLRQPPSVKPWDTIDFCNQAISYFSAANTEPEKIYAEDIATLSNAILSFIFAFLNCRGGCHGKITGKGNSSGSQDYVIVSYAH